MAMRRSGLSSANIRVYMSKYMLVSASHGSSVFNSMDMVSQADPPSMASIWEHLIDKSMKNDNWLGPNRSRYIGENLNIKGQTSRTFSASKIMNGLQKPHVSIIQGRRWQITESHLFPAHASNLKNNLQYPKFPSHFKWTMKETSGLERRGAFGCLLQDFTWLPLLTNDPKNYIYLILTIISCNKGPPYIHHTASVRKFSREQKTCQGHLCAKTDEDVFHIGSDKKWQCDNWQLTIGNVTIVTWQWLEKLNWFTACYSSCFLNYYFWVGICGHSKWKAT